MRFGSIGTLRDAFILFVAAATGMAPAGADAIFQDGFDECGAGRWSSGDPSPIAETLTGLTPLALANALGACSPSLTSASFLLSDASAPNATALDQMANSQSAILDAFGTGGMVPTAGGAMVALSTGKSREEGQSNWTAPENGSTFRGPNAGPPVFMAAHHQIPTGVSCPIVSLNFYDSITLRVTLTVPQGATRLAFDWRFVVSDFPEWGCTAFKDYFLAIVSTGSSESLPADRNVVIDGLGFPVTVDSPEMVICNGCSAGSGALTGTGYGTSDAAATQWHTAYVPVVGGETLVLDLVAMDTGDGTFDNLILLDGMRWLAD